MLSISQAFTHSQDQAIIYMCINCIKQFTQCKLQNKNEKTLRAAGLEPTQRSRHRNLNPTCLPFHHARAFKIERQWNRTTVKWICNPLHRHYASRPHYKYM